MCGATANDAGMSIAFERIETWDADARKAILDAIIEYNDSLTGRREPAQPLGLLLRDPSSRQIVGGLWGVSYYSWLFVELLALPAAMRGKGVGSRLMREAEAVARERGCLGVWLDTFSFQARGFYEKLGYSVFGQMNDFPPGHQRFFLQRRFDRVG